MQNENKHGHNEAKNETLTVKVRYIGARQAFIEPHAREDETLITFKPRVLSFFHLMEGNGGKVYTLAVEGTAVTDLGKTLGQLAAGKHELKLDLLEQFEQG